MRPPSLCELEISLQGVKLIMSLEDEYDTLDEVKKDLLKVKWTTFEPPGQQVSHLLSPHYSSPLVARLTQLTTYCQN